MREDIRVIGLYSPVMGCGKTTIADHLVKNRGFTVVKFAGTLKSMAACMLFSLGYDHDTVMRMVVGDLKEEKISGLGDVTPRLIMQTLGSEWGRECIDNDLWVKIAMSKVETVLSAGGRVVVDDVRFPNEYTEIARRTDSFMFRVTRDEAMLTNDHGSEGALEDKEFDATIKNDSSIEHLRGAVDYLLSTNYE